jgi:hypothetical protein
LRDLKGVVAKQNGAWLLGPSECNRADRNTTTTLWKKKVAMAGWPVKVLKILYVL